MSDQNEQKALEYRSKLHAIEEEAAFLGRLPSIAPDFVVSGEPVYRRLSQRLNVARGDTLKEMRALSWNPSREVMAAADVLFGYIEEMDSKLAALTRELEQSKRERDELLAGRLNGDTNG